jgi:hypothetical protein
VLPRRAAAHGAALVVAPEIDTTHSSSDPCRL